ncbi:hypothetical protein ARALYDRAFT_895677 [Arabidopsis lyrata subsp. lyrata]|uniref:Uncharacterized protein n=1 Tax=Arabidopsis lyrata subsp. lyrata TaxID=81972 RepID=D7KV50_ARALL|nr:hypothetical protein ARALYDRAFT_895677 [Arabidopsis lyrata subsp. lyrata]
MDDFLEMERLVAFPETLDGSGKSGPESVTGEAVVGLKEELESEVKCNREEAGIQIKNSLAAEVEVLTCRIKQLEVKLEKLEAEKDELKREVKCNREVESTLRLELEAIACDKMEQDEVLES